MELEYLIEITVMEKFFRIKYIENLKLKEQKHIIIQQPVENVVMQMPTVENEMEKIWAKTVILVINHISTGLIS